MGSTVIHIPGLGDVTEEEFMELRLTHRGRSGPELSKEHLEAIRRRDGFTSTRDESHPPNAEKPLAHHAG